MFHERHCASGCSQVGGKLTAGALVIFLLCGGLPGASDRQAAPAPTPDFSGEWVLDTASPSVIDVPRTLSVRQFQLEKSGRGDSTRVTFPSITIERRLDTGPVTETHQIGIIGGTVGGIGRDGRQSGSSTSYAIKWEGNALVFETESHTERVDPATWSERYEVWSLDEAGRLAIVITNRSSDDPARRVTLHYRRR